MKADTWLKFFINVEVIGVFSCKILFVKFSALVYLYITYFSLGVEFYQMAFNHLLMLNIPKLFFGKTAGQHCLWKFDKPGHLTALW